MRILTINPNTSVQMTEHIAAQAQSTARPDTEIIAVTAAFGAEVIASRASYAIASHAALDAFARRFEGADVVLLACFGDPGLEALREIAPIPVIGMLDATITSPAAKATPFAIITAGAAWVPMLMERVALTPHSGLLRGVFAINAHGLDVRNNPSAALAALQQATDRATDAGATAIVLGGSALAGLSSSLHSTATLIDPLQCAVLAAEQALQNTAHTPTRPALRSQGLTPALAELLAASPQ